MISTFVWAFELQEDWDYVNNLSQLFKSRGGSVYYVELETDTAVRFERNKSANRLEHKPSKRDIEWSENDLKESMEKHRMNSLEGEITDPHYIRINNTNMSAEDTANLIKETFDL